MEIPSVKELFKQGVHFGHKASKRHPKASSFIYTKYNDIHIIDLEKTVAKLKEAITFIQSIIKKNGQIVFIGSKRQAKDIVKTSALGCDMPYIVGRWIGGTFTNFINIRKLVNKLEKLEKEKEDGSWEVYTKKERVGFNKELNKLQDTVGGIKKMKKLPQAIFVIDISKERTAIREAHKMNIPIIALADTNVNPELVDYHIPANDDAIKSIKLITNLIAEAINDVQE